MVLNLNPPNAPLMAALEEGSAFSTKTDDNVILKPKSKKRLRASPDSNEELPEKPKRRRLNEL